MSNPTTIKMAMFLQDPCYPDLVEDFELSLKHDYLDGMSSSRIIIRDEDLSGYPLNTALEWSDHGDLSFKLFAEQVAAARASTTPETGRSVEIAGALEEVPLSRLVDNPQFRHVNTFAVAMHTLQLVEEELGHKVSWDGPLVIRPHAFESDEAYYDSSDHSINLGFTRGEFPHRMIWNCLSHDTIAHELGHAILDGLRPRFGTGTWLDSNALHESFADLTAIFSALEHEKIVKQMGVETSEDLEEPSLVTRLFERYGLKEPYIRSALTNREYWPDYPQEPHDRGEIWTGALFKILVLLTDEVKKRYSKPFPFCVAKAVKWLRGILLRTVSYLPPTGMTMPAWARLIYLADEEVYPDQADSRPREIAKEVFRKRGLWDQGDLKNPVFDPPVLNGKKIEQALNEDHLAATVMDLAGELRIPRGHGVLLLPPWVSTRTREVDTLVDPKGHRKTKKITEHCLEYAFRLPGWEGKSFGGVLVMDEDYNPKRLVTDPPQTRERDGSLRSPADTLAEWRQRARRHEPTKHKGPPNHRRSLARAPRPDGGASAGAARPTARADGGSAPRSWR
jgi:hypothetical protein